MAMVVTVICDLCRSVILAFLIALPSVIRYYLCFLFVGYMLCMVHV